MEATEVIIARLVLGYLKEEKCRTAYKEFLKTSHHLECDSITRSKYLPTRFVGLTLQDILSEYFQILKIVQGRLEATNFYNECHTRTSLIQQLLYLLSKSQSSRTSTPCPSRSPLESNLDETSPSHVDHISDIEATPIHTLPGNVRCTSENSYLYKSPRRKSDLHLNKSTTPTNIQSPNSEDVSEVLAHALLENKEFHEKIAQTINKVAEKRYRVSSELNKTIKTVVKETEADPIFDKILDEIIGSTSVIENGNEVESSSTESSTTKGAEKDSESKQKRPHKRLNSNELVDHFNQHNIQTVDEQNDEAVRSIIANSKLKSNLKGNDQEVQVNSEVTIFDGSLDKYLMSNTCNANTQTQPIQNPLYINTAGSYISTTGLLMVPSSIPSNGSLQIDPTKQLYLVNKQPPINWNIPQVNTTAVITERDILAMPTVIVNDNKQDVPILEQVVQNPPRTTHKPPQKIIPKPLIEIAPEYLNKVQKQTGLKNVIYPKTKQDSKIKGTTSDTPANDCPRKPASVSTSNDKSMPTNLFKDDEEHKTSATNVDSKLNEEKPPAVEQLTPAAVECIQKTPKSESHVRNLDFSSPQRLTTDKKIVKSDADEDKKKKPTKLHKKQAVKSLFNPQSSESNDKETDRRPSKTWDADLRANIILPEEDTITTAKKKKKTPVRKVKKKSKKNATVEDQLNSTAHNAALIEAALQTPIKSEDRYENSDCKTECISNEDSEKRDVLTVKNNAVGKTDVPRKLTDCKEAEECNSSKTVLSPSKLNANKRKFVNSDTTDCAESLIKLSETNTFVTPDTIKNNSHHPIKANRNITLLFDTPSKNVKVPKTPGRETPNTNLYTPFTKMLEANLKGIDISSLPTPTIPLTPSFPPFTPNVETSSPYSNRPTDYSTSSSYYQPSDTEPNKSLEANVMELEKQPVTILSNVRILNDSGNCRQDKQKNKGDIPCSSGINKVKEHVNIFNRNIIGRKNLNLVERNHSSSSSSEDSSSESEIDTTPEKSNETVIYNKKTVETPKRTYSLRNRNTANKEIIIKKEVTTKQVTHKNKKSVVNPVDNVSKTSDGVEFHEQDSHLIKEEKEIDTKSPENNRPECIADSRKKLPKTTKNKPATKKKYEEISKEVEWNKFFKNKTSKSPEK